MNFERPLVARGARREMFKKLLTNPTKTARLISGGYTPREEGGNIMSEPTRRIYAIVAKKVKNTGRFSFLFKFNSQAPFSEFRDIECWGAITDDTPAAWSPDPPSGPVDPDVFYVFTVGGQVYTSGNQVDFKTRVAECPNAVLLVNEEQFVRLEAACRELDIPLGSFHYDGELATA
jgi:hypothetical protein